MLVDALMRPPLSPDYSKETIMLRNFSLYASLPLLLIGAVTAAAAPPAAGDWPQWRGPNRDGISTDKSLLKKWPENGPEVLWQVDNVGVGYSSFAVTGGRIYTQGDLNGVEHVIALDAADGSLVWAVQPEPAAAALKERIAKELKRLDADGSGTVSEAEALAGLGWNFNKFNQEKSSTAGADVQELGRQRAVALLKALDKDADGRLTGKEAASFGEEFFRIDTADDNADAAELAAARTARDLKMLDADADGVLSRKECRGTVLDRSFSRIDDRKPGERRGDDKLTAAELTTYFARLQKGKDGQVTVDELATYITARYPGQDGVLTAAELKGFYGGYRNGQGDGPRGTPAVAGDKVYAIGGNGDVTCLAAATGKTIWHLNMVADLGGRRPGWGYSESPVIEGDMLIVTPGGPQGCVAALNKDTGEVIWQSRQVKEAAHYSTAAIAEIGGVKQVVQFARENVFGLKLSDGSLMWKYDGANNGTANVCTPIVAGDNVFASSAYGTGGGLAAITTAGAKQTAKEVYFDKKMAVHHGGIVKSGDHIYGFGSGGLICMNFKTGDKAWNARSVGNGSLTVADGMLYLLGERHELALAELTPEGYRETGRIKLESQGRPSWAHPVVTGGRMYIRDQSKLTVYNVRQ